MSYSAALLQQPSASLLNFNSRRSPVYGTKGMVACSQPLAAEAGLRILQAGGNAADAAVAIAAALGVTEPGSTGIGGDAFALFYSAKERKVRCMQGNGAAPAGLSLAAVRAAGIHGKELPLRSPLAVSVPGAAALWEDAVTQWGSGSLTLLEVLGPAIELAEEGFPVSPMAAYDWGRAVPVLQEAAAAGGPEGLAAVRALLREDGSAPKAGQLWRNPDLASTYRRVGELGAVKGYYTGPIAEAIVEALKVRGGVMELSDLANHQTLEVDALCTNYKGYTVWEVPPPTAGVVALMALNIMESHTAHQKQQQDAASEKADPPVINLGSGTPSQQQWTPDQVHLAIEACRMAFADALARVADPLAAQQPLSEMICADRAGQRYRQYFDMGKACSPAPCEVLAAAGTPKQVKGGDTCQWVVVDGQGNAASFINSIYMQYGTGIIPAGSGFCLQNRCHGFYLEPGHPNSLAPGKRPYHTIIPALLTDSTGDLTAAFGCMGGYMQPQGHLQILFNMLELGMDPQAAVDQPRFCVHKIDSAVGPASVLESHVLLEQGILGDKAQRQLAEKGHNLEVVTGFGRSVFGKAQVIVRDKSSGVLVAGSDPRGDGCAMGW